MYNIAICDDETKILEDITDNVKQQFSLLNIEVSCFSTNDPKQLIAILEKETIDILFLDIDIPHISGIEVAKYMLGKDYKTLLIFVTSYDSLVYQTFQYQPFGFIRKNYFNEEISEVIKRADKTLNDKKASLTIKVNNELIKIDLCNIKYFEGDANYVNVYTTDSCYRYRETLGNLEKELFRKDFIRVHKGYLINLQFIHVFKGNEVQLDDETVIPVGRSYSENVKKKIMEAMRN